MKEDLKFDITIEQGSNYPLDITYSDDDDNPVSVAGWTVESVIREATHDPYCVPFICSADRYGFHLRMSAERTMQLTFASGVYDIFVMDPERQTRTKLLSGKVTVIPDVTRNMR